MEAGALVLHDTREAALAYYRKVLDLAAERGVLQTVQRDLARGDLFYLLLFVLGRKDINHDWLFDRCREVQREPNGRLDLWPREHFKCEAAHDLVTLADGRREPLSAVVPGDRVISIGPDGKAEPQTVISVADTGLKPVRKFRTATGREFSITDDHRMMAPSGKWVEGRELRVSSWVGLIRRVPRREPRQTMSIAECRYLGMIMADGSTITSGVTWTKPDADLTEKFCAVAAELGLRPWVRPAKGPKCQYVRVRGARALHERFGIFGRRSTDKRVPAELFHQPDGHLWEFLAGFFECDGNVNTQSGQAVITLANAGLIDDLRHICDLLGVRCSVYETRENGHAGATTLMISGAGSIALMDAMMPLASERKAGQLRQVAAKAGTPGKADPIPDGWQQYLSRPPAARFFRRQGLRPAFESDFTSRAKVAAFAEADDSDALRQYVAADVVWDRIESIGAYEPVPTRDIQVSGGQSFIANGVVSHNSSIGTFGLVIQDILNDPDITVGIFSFTRPIAKAFLRQIKREFESNERLRQLFPDVVWENPQRDAPKWSEDDGIILKRRGNPKESTIEAWGLVDHQPTSKHYRLLVYDDVVTRESVTNPDMIAKVTDAWATSRALGTEGGATRYYGTRWAYADTYRTIIDRGAAVERRYTVTVDGTADGEPVLRSREWVATQRREMGPYVFAAQHLLDPAADRTQGFREEWLRYYDQGGDFNNLNKYLLVDPANDKKKQSDYTAMAVIGLGADENYYLLDIIRDRLSLTERADAVFSLHRRWKPRGVGYEKYGMQADIDYIKERMGRENYRFDVEEVGGQVSKTDRIRRMIPVFESGRFLLPHTLIKADYENIRRDLVDIFIREEYNPFPVGLHDDLFDAISRIWDITVIWPKPIVKEDRYARARPKRRPTSWLAA